MTKEIELKTYLSAVALSVALAAGCASPASACGGLFGGICNTLVKAVQDTGHAIEKGAQDTGKGMEKAAHDTGKSLEKAAQDTGRGAEKGAHDTGKSLEKAAQDIGKVKVTYGFGTTGSGGHGMRDNGDIDDDGENNDSTDTPAPSEMPAPLGFRPMTLSPPPAGLSGATLERPSAPLPTIFPPDQVGGCRGMECEGPAETNPAMDLPEKPIEPPTPVAD